MVLTSYFKEYLWLLKLTFIWVQNNEIYEEKKEGKSYMQLAISCSAIIQTGAMYLGEFLQANWTIDLCPHSASFQTAVFTFGSVLKINSEEAVTSHHIMSFIHSLENLHTQPASLSVRVNKYFDCWIPVRFTNSQQRKYSSRKEKMPKLLTANDLKFSLYIYIPTLCKWINSVVRVEQQQKAHLTQPVWCTALMHSMGERLLQ